MSQIILFQFVRRLTQADCYYFSGTSSFLLQLLLCWLQHCSIHWWHCYHSDVRSHFLSAFPASTAAATTSSLFFWRLITGDYHYHYQIMLVPVSHLLPALSFRECWCKNFLQTRCPSVNQSTVSKHLSKLCRRVSMARSELELTGHNAAITWLVQTSRQPT